jgi:hypothetical protein
MEAFGILAALATAVQALALITLHVLPPPAMTRAAMR